MNIILVDASYTSFFRFFATMRWFSLSNKETYKELKDNSDYNWIDNNIFFEKYKKMYFESVKKLFTKEILNNSKIIFCMDCPQNEIWRHEISDCYKGNRVDLSKKHNFKSIFKYTYDTHIPELIKNNGNIFSIKESKIEGDDIIALSVNYIKKNYPNYKIYLISGDKDFYQLGYDNLYFINYKKKEPIQFSLDEAKKELNLKIINGDCSDNIASIFPKEIKISNKRKKLIRENSEELQNYLNEYKIAKEIYDKNKKLIDFTYIPKKFHNKVFKKIKNHINQ